VTGRNLEQLSYRIQLVEGLFTKYACAAKTQSVSVYRGDRHPITQFHGWLKNIFWLKWHPKLKNQNLREGVLCAQSTEKENFSVLLPNMWHGPVLGRLLWAISHKAQLLR